jgi:hypothetical protein
MKYGFEHFYTHSQDLQIYPLQISCNLRFMMMIFLFLNRMPHT